MRMIQTRQLIQIGLVLALMLLSVWGVPSLGLDSYEYIYFSPIRPPVYPFFLWMLSIFGPYRFLAAVWVQGIITTATLFYTWYWLCNRLNMPRWLSWLVLVISAWNIILRFEINSSILSEALAFPFFILCFTLFIDCSKSFNFTKIMLYVLLVNLLVLTRAQFYYFYITFAFLITLYFLQKIPRKNLLSTCVLMVSSIIAAFFINHSYHYFLNGKFSDSAVLGPQLIAAPLFLSNSNYEKYITDPQEKFFFQKTIKLLESKKLTRDTSEYLKNSKTLDNDLNYYKLVFQPLFHFVYYENLRNMTPYQLNKITLDISKKLYLVQFKENIRFYIAKGISIFGNFSIFLIFLFIFVLYLAYLWHITRNRNVDLDYFQIFIGSSSLIILANVFFVVLFVIASERYFIYSNFLLICLGAAVADKLFSKYDDHKTMA